MIKPLLSTKLRSVPYHRPTDPPTPSPTAGPVAETMGCRLRRPPADKRARPPQSASMRRRSLAADADRPTDRQTDQPADRRDDFSDGVYNDAWRARLSRFSAFSMSWITRVCDSTVAAPRYHTGCRFGLLTRRRLCRPNAAN